MEDVSGCGRLREKQKLVENKKKQRNSLERNRHKDTKIDNYWLNTTQDQYNSLTTEKKKHRNETN